MGPEACSDLQAQVALFHREGNAGQHVVAQ